MQCSYSSLVSFPLLSNWGLGVGRGRSDGLMESGICRVTDLVSGSEREFKTGVGGEGV